MIFMVPFNNRWGSVVLERAFLHPEKERLFHHVASMVVPETAVSSLAAAVGSPICREGNERERKNLLFCGSVQPHCLDAIKSSTLDL